MGSIERLQEEEFRREVIKQRLRNLSSGFNKALKINNGRRFV